MEKIQKTAFLIMLLLTLFLTGCSFDIEKEKVDDNRTSTIESSDPEKLVDYYNFKSFDFSNKSLIFDKNFFFLYYKEDTDWYDVLYQDQELFNLISQKYFDDIIVFDDSDVVFENGVISNLKLIYNDNSNPIVTKEIPVLYFDVTKNSDGTSTDILFERYDVSQFYNNYEVIFKTYSDDYYSLWIFKYSSNRDDLIDIRYYEKYNGPKTYYIDNIPVATVWKDKLGYRVDILNYDEESVDLSNITKYYVVKHNVSSSSNAWFWNHSIFQEYLLKMAFSEEDITYEVEYIDYDEIMENLSLKLNIYNDDKTIDITKTFNIDDYYLQGYTESNLDFNIEISRVSENIVNITFIDKDSSNIMYSYSLSSNK